MTGFVLFHGTALPPRAWARAVRADVVLQPFHPLVREDGYSAWFPNARRWVYTNPSTIDPLRQHGVPAHLVHRDEADRWALPRLRFPAGVEIALADAAELSRIPGVDGLFVDDVDRLIDAGEEVLDAYLAGMDERTDCPVFVNRGFVSLSRWRRLAAVLVEGADVAEVSAQAWFDAVALPALLAAADEGCRIHRLEYGPAPALSQPACALDRLLSSLCTSARRVACERLDDWEDWL